MTPLYLYNGSLIRKDGALGTSVNCCCDGEQGNCSCAIFFMERLRLMVVNCATNKMDDRTQESLISLIGSNNHNYVNGLCNLDSCPGGAVHITCQISDPNGMIIPCSNICSCDPICDPFLPDPVPALGCQLPANRQPPDPICGFRNSVKMNGPQLQWKPGYPDAFNGAPWMVLRDFYTEGILNPGCRDIGCGNAPPA